MPVSVTVTKYDDANAFFNRLLNEWTEKDTAFYRGEGDASWKLQPSAWRSDSINTLAGHIRDQESKFPWTFWLTDDMAADTVNTEKYLSIEGATEERLRELVYRLRAESALIDAFCEQCDSVALSVPGVSRTDSRVRLVNLQAQSALKFIGEDVPAFELSTAHALAQHSGVPTRLLDFSDNPLKAAFFAAHRGPDSDSKSDDIAVWILRKGPRSRFPLSQFSSYGGIETIRVLRSQIAFLHAQDGLFIACNAGGNRHFLTHGCWPTLDQMMSGWTLEKLLLARSKTLDLRKRLERAGVTQSRMMPSYEQIARHVRSYLLDPAM